MDKYDLEEHLRAIGWAMWFAFLGGILVFSCVLFLQLAVMAALSVVTGLEPFMPPWAIQVSAWSSLFGFAGGGIYGWMKGFWYF